MEKILGVAAHAEKIQINCFSIEPKTHNWEGSFRENHIVSDRGGSRIFSGGGGGGRIYKKISKILSIFF